jgi:L-seryl-tRNA(Ser) seleniumtransferase
MGEPEDGNASGLRQLPSVDHVLRSEAAASLARRFPRQAIREAVRAALDLRRRERRDGDATLPPMPSPNELEARIAAARRSTLRRAINATGTVLHTNLGRAPLSAAALAAVAEVGAGYSTLEYAVEQRTRGSRQAHGAPLLCALTGAEDALVTNNNAGAVLVALAALAAGREVIVSRGELVEIGGGFRIPDVMRASGARLREVGTTNKTRLSDYADAIGADTALILKVHRSNFAMVGFTEEVTLDALAPLARKHHLPLMADLGSGAFIDTASLGLPPEPTVADAVANGADLVAFSGDKLLGGPQAGLLVGGRGIIERIAGHPLMRALRPDKLTLAALIATLASYQEGTARDDIPTLRMLAASAETLAHRRQALRARIASLPGLSVDDAMTQTLVGGGALPLAKLDSAALTLRATALTAEDLAQALADGEPSVVVRIHADAVLIDVRTVADDEVPLVAAAIARVLGGHA